MTAAEGSSGGAADRVLTALLGAVEAVLDADPPQERSAGTRWVVCAAAAELVDVPVVAHVQYDATEQACRVCLMRRRPFGVPDVMYLDEGVTPDSAADWWTVSRARQRLFATMEQPHLVELPLATERDAPSLVVLGRATPFLEAEADLLAAAHRALRLVERVIDRIWPPPWAARRATGGVPQAVPALTPRELEVLAMLSEGLLARSIAHRLQVSERTVHKHLGSLYRKLDVHDRLLAVRRAETIGLIPASPGGSSTHCPVPAEVTASVS